MSAATIISQAFGEGADLYTTVLGLENDEPTPSQLRKAYYRRALLYHPDKQQDKSEEEVEGAKLKFQAISLAYTILSDEDKRREYDESGEMDDNDYDNDDFGGKNGGSKSGSDMWKEFFSSTFGKVTVADIDQFTQSYKCSDEEEKDVLKYYTMFKGNLDKMLECVMCSDVIDKERWVQDYIKPAIQDGSVKDFSDQIEKTLTSPAGKGASKSKGKKRKTKAKKSTSRRKKVESEDEKEEDCADEVNVEVAVEVEEGGEEVNEEDEDDQSIEDRNSSSEKSLHDSDLSADENDAASDEERTETEEEKTETEEDSDDSSNQKTQQSTSSKERKQRSTPQRQTRKNSVTNSAPANKKKRKKEEKANDPDDLVAAIRGNAVARRGREESFGNFMSSLEERYAPSKARKKNKRKNNKINPEPDIPDDEFAKIQARLLKKRK